MRRGSAWATALVVAGVLAVALAAALDAVRGSLSDRRSGVPASPFPASLVDELEAAALGGALHYTDAGCVRRSLALPALTSSPAQRVACQNELRPRPPVAAAGPAFPDGRPRTGCRRATVHLVGQRRFLRRLPGCARAGLPDGSLLHAAGEAVVARTADCVEPAGGCDRELLPPRSVRRAALRHPNIPEGAPAGVTVLDAAWLGDERYAALVAGWPGGRLARLGPQVLLALFAGGELVATNAFFAGGVGGLAVSPAGSFVAAVGEGIALVRRDGSSLPLTRPFAGGHAIAWSRDERWTAIATRSSILLVPTAELVVHARTGTAPSLVRIPIAVRDLAWQEESR